MKHQRTVAGWLFRLIQANPAALRPLLDIHHIEMFLVWSALWQIGAFGQIAQWLMNLQDRLFTRRSGHAEFPFLESRSSLESVFEFVANAERPEEFQDQSSVFLMCLLELACSVADTDGRDPLVEAVYRRLVLGRDDCGTPLPGCSPIDLMLWGPPTDWADRVLLKSLAREGECIMVSLYPRFPEQDTNGPTLFERINRFVLETRANRPFELPGQLPVSVIVLACLKHSSPLPPELWRKLIFKIEKSSAAMLQ